MDGQACARKGDLWNDRLAQGIAATDGWGSRAREKAIVGMLDPQQGLLCQWPSRVRAEHRASQAIVVANRSIRTNQLLGCQFVKEQETC